MNLSLLAPLLYLAIGLGLGRLPFEIKSRAAALLTRVLIPTVIIYNIATHKPGVFTLMLGIILIMATMLLLSRFGPTRPIGPLGPLGSQDPIQNLCFCYLNIGWLGLPVAAALWGDEAAMVIISAYVGGSLFGNAISPPLMQAAPSSSNSPPRSTIGPASPHKHTSPRTNTWPRRLRNTLQAPPVWALLVGLACIPFASLIEQHTQPLYQTAKFLMSFFGMAILGIWLANTPLKRADFKQALKTFTLRGLLLLPLIHLFILICQHYQIDLVTRNQPALYLISLLPPAANLIVLETHYLKTGRSAPLIACGTCISLIAIALYAAALHIMALPRPLF